jgi:hypothetical protein
MSTTAFISAICASLAVIAVSIYVIQRQLKASQARQAKINAGREFLQQERQKRIDSIRILLQAVEDDDKLTWTEASIRIKNLLDQLSVDFSEHETVSAFYELEAKTQHIPTHDQWNQLPANARMKYRLEMDNLETQLLERLRAGKQVLLAHSFPMPD